MTLNKPITLWIYTAELSVIVSGVFFTAAGELFCQKKPVLGSELHGERGGVSLYRGSAKTSAGVKPRQQIKPWPWPLDIW
jgi:hypothetical protein